ncbi:MAG: hypothetical protein M3322_04815 [Actinomycetota bacterium]|nr:hypothetical protein [Actinomycetota bacterium]
MKPRRHRRRKGVCALCEQPIERGDPIRWVTLPGYDDGLAAHSRCYDRDWESIESGLEGFPLRFSGRTEPP